MLAEQVRNLKHKLRGYGVYPYSNNFPKQISSEDRIVDSIVDDLLRAPEVGKGKGQFIFTNQEKQVSNRH